MTNEIPGSRATTVCVRIVVAVALVVGLAVPAAALPQVEIKAQARLALGKVRLLGDGVAEVSGQLSDKLTGDGLGEQRVFVEDRRAGRRRRDQARRLVRDHDGRRRWPADRSR